MQNILKKYLKSDKRIFEILLYGSAVKGKINPRDKDILVIFKEGTLRERLDSIQQIKQKLGDQQVDIKQILITDLFKTLFLGKTGAIIEGVNVSDNKHFCTSLGFKPYSLFWYSLDNLNHTQKVKFNYILAGRNTKGIIEQMGGVRIASGAVKIPIEQSLPFEELLKSNNVKYKKKNILEEI